MLYLYSNNQFHAHMSHELIELKNQMHKRIKVGGRALLRSKGRTDE